MKTRILLTLSLVALLFVPSFAQQTLVLSNTTTSAAVTVGATTVSLTSVSGSGNGAIAPAVGHEMFIDLEAMIIRAISSTTVTVSRGADGTSAQAHASGAVVLTGPTNYFQRADPPYGACTTSTVIVRPWLNVKTGSIWLCRSSVWKATNVQPIVYDSVTPY